jgi:pyridinium-3,5-biscarboxylic acid mononucleotide sulfurtransferase
VTIEGLSQVDRAEHYLRTQGFHQLRVRHHGDLARIELDDDGLKRIANDPQLMGRIAENLRNIGFAYVTIDLDGYRQGSSNRFQTDREFHNSLNYETRDPN